jgi:hypothetical protein
MNKFFLIGIPNCGKTTLGQRAAGEPCHCPSFHSVWRTFAHKAILCGSCREDGALSPDWQRSGHWGNNVALGAKAGVNENLPLFFMAF